MENTNNAMDMPVTDIGHEEEYFDEPHLFPVFGEIQFSQDEACTIQEQLARKLEKDEISWRPGPGGQKLFYLETWRAAEIANRIFGFNGWTTSVINLQTDYLDNAGGKISCGISTTVRVTLKDGSYHEDVGYGTSDNQRTKGAALEKAKKEAVSDGMKRALRLFGNRLGNSIYDKEHVKNTQKPQPKSDPMKTELSTPGLQSPVGSQVPFHASNGSQPFPSPQNGPAPPSHNAQFSTLQSPYNNARPINGVQTTKM